MYNLTEYSSNYSETTGILWFCSKDKATNFNGDITNDNNFKSFKDKTKLLGKGKVDGVMLPLYQEKTIKSCKNLLVKDLKDQFIGMNIKQKVRIKIKMNIGIFSNQFLLESNRLFVLVYSNKDDHSKRSKTRRYHLPKGIIKTCNIIIEG